MNLYVVPCLLTADFYKEEKYILSQNDKQIIFPKLQFESYSNIQNLVTKAIIELFADQQFAKTYILPNFIDINNEYISEIYDCNNDLYFLYGCTCPKLKPIDDLYWCPFSMVDDTIYKELGVINYVIEKSF